MPRKQRKYNERIEIGRGPDGKRIRKWIRADTKPELKALRRQAYRETESARNPSAITFGSYKDTWFATYKSNTALGTQTMYTNALNCCDKLDKKKLTAITATDLQQLINDNWAHPRACQILSMTIKQIFNAAIRDGIMTGPNPAEDLALPKRKRKEARFLTDEEMKKVLQCNFTDWERLYVDVLRYTGMRPSEGIALKYEDIDYENKLIHVTRSIEYSASESRFKATKTDSDRDIPLNRSLASVLKSAGKNEGYVFLPDGNPMSKGEYESVSRKIMRKMHKALGCKDVVIYSFRHTFATFLYYKGCRTGLISIKKAAQIMGHSEQMFINTYTHIDDSQEQIQAIVDML